jgi:hypothetical protein
MISPNRIVAAGRALCSALAIAVLAVSAPAGPVGAATASKTVPSQYVQIDRMVVPVIQEGELKGHLTLVLYLELNNPDDRPSISAKMDVLRDEYLWDLSQYVTRRPFILRDVSIPEVKGIILKATDRVIGTGKVKAVLVKVVATRHL